MNCVITQRRIDLVRGKQNFSPSLPHGYFSTGKLRHSIPAYQPRFCLARSCGTTRMGTRSRGCAASCHRAAHCLPRPGFHPRRHLGRGGSSDDPLDHARHPRWSAYGHSRHRQASNGGGIDVFRIASGQIVELWQNFDHLGMLRQLGVIPTLE
jgi:hypothetical protein